MSLHNPLQPFYPPPLFPSSFGERKLLNGATLTVDTPASQPYVSRRLAGSFWEKGKIGSRVTDVVRWDKCSNDYLIHNPGNHPHARETLPGILVDFN